MRFLPALALAAVSAALAGQAWAVEDRYGPPPAATPAPDSAPAATAPPTHAEAYHGPFLGWSSKGAPGLTPVAPQAAPVRVAILTAPTRPAAAPVAIAAANRASQPAMLAPAVAPPPPAAIAATPIAPAPPLVAPKPPPQAEPAQAFANAAAPSAAQSAATPAAPPALPPTKTRYYSVLRDYGLQPDPIEAPKHQSLVLIGPADDAGPANPDDDGDGDADSDTHKPKASTSDLF